MQSIESTPIVPKCPRGSINMYLLQEWFSREGISPGDEKIKLKELLERMVVPKGHAGYIPSLPTLGKFLKRQGYTVERGGYELYNPSTKSYEKSSKGSRFTYTFISKG